MVETSVTESTENPDKLPEEIRALINALVRELRVNFGPVQPNSYIQDEVERVTVQSIVNEGGATYSGQTLTDGTPDGFGFKVFKAGSFYEGYWRVGLYHGRGRMIFDNGDVYEGDYVDGSGEGYGEYFQPDGGKYTGEWKADLHHGYGVGTIGDGSVYEGQWVNGKKQGQGKLTYADGSFYSGTFYEDEVNGQGTAAWTNGKTYTGQWVNNSMHGYGVLTY